MRRNRVCRRQLNRPGFFLVKIDLKRIEKTRFPAFPADYVVLPINRLKTRPKGPGGAFKAYSVSDLNLSRFRGMMKTANLVKQFLGVAIGDTVRLAAR
jgi:hypothetical protein